MYRGAVVMMLLKKDRLQEKLVGLICRNYNWFYLTVQANIFGFNLVVLNNVFFAVLRFLFFAKWFVLSRKKLKSEDSIAGFMLPFSALKKSTQRI